MRDGDLWSVASRFLLQRPPGSFAVRKVKAHLTKEQMESGMISKTDWEGNAVADQAANDAVRLDRSSPEWYLCLQHVRQAKSDRIVRLVQTMMADVIIGDDSCTAKPRHAPREGAHRAMAMPHFAPVDIWTPRRFSQ
eukprot:15471692-Alexandrium_andersonii.AAC.1